ncbi:oxidoreductase, short chain dehydrogenase/reductase family protein [Onchocerca flexuosa]|uniref:Oxidoreductase, short chain dehydrogenase/reductase family protein n=1 Tax=Onchocerca flexuosa TaxID=387005 RepID=A0A238BSH7_9BILA|nr:oxidoreductase, short chain dehydrogenase/reductase family protein [Onchocerca flexuosa]
MSKRFGRDLVKRCLQNELTVFAGCRRAISVKELEKNCSLISPGRLHTFQMDVTDDESVRKSKKIVDAVLKEKNLGPYSWNKCFCKVFSEILHALVNNAGVSSTYYYDDFLTLDDYKEMSEVNLYGVIRVIQTFRDLIKKSRGRLVTCSSAIILFSSPSNGPYCCSKLAVQAYTNVIRHELLPYDVDVIEIAPGCFETGMTNIETSMKMYDTVWYRASQKLRDEFGHDYNDKVATETTWVIDAYYEAIVAKRPKLLYRIGWDALFM